MRLLLQTIFLCVSVFFFTCIQSISVSTASANDLFQNFLTLSPPPGQKIMVSPLEMLCDFSGRIMRGFKKACFEPSLQNARPPTFPKKQK